MRVIAFLTLLCLSPLVPIWLLLIFMAGYAVVFEGYELILIGVLIDGFFGGAALVPYYTLCIIGIVIVAEWIKPRLFIYADAY